ncbi:MAG: hypothetical protein NT090_03380 [Acidobacteria bacterium]|nr:hypothetical protein [Acidobacteriota bacterium]
MRPDIVVENAFGTHLFSAETGKRRVRLPRFTGRNRTGWRLPGR